jgi:hypothetical protein
MWHVVLCITCERISYLPAMHCVTEFVRHFDVNKQ